MRLTETSETDRQRITDLAVRSEGDVCMLGGGGGGAQEAAAEEWGRPGAGYQAYNCL